MAIEDLEGNENIMYCLADMPWMHIELHGCAGLSY
jgi:hypothetical protein